MGRRDGDPGAPQSRREVLLLGTATMMMPFAAYGRQAYGSEAESLPATAAPADASDPSFEQARAQWRRLLIGDGEPVRPAMTKRIIGGIDAAGTAARAQLRQSVAGSQPFPDVPVGNVSANVTTIYRRLRAIALAYAVPGTSLTNDATALEEVSTALRWMTTNCYASGTRFYDNWWDWQIGAPQALIDTLLLLRPSLPAGDLAANIAAIEHFVPDPGRRRLPNGSDRPDPETAANLLDKVIVVQGAGLLSEDAAKVALALDRVSPIFQYVTAGDGFYLDGSFIQHTNIPYIGGYGVPLITSLARLLVLVDGSRWTVPGETGNIWHWLRDSYAPFLYDGVMLESVRGRSVSRAAQIDRTVGRGVIAPMAVLAQAAPVAERTWIVSAVKGWASRSGQADSFGTTLYEASRLTAILADSTVAPRAEPGGLAFFPAMARGVLRGSGFAADIALFSPGIVAFEYGNGENSRGWWTGMGQMQIHDGDLTRYGGGYYPTVDFHRLPGTTTDHSGTGEPKSWGGGYFNPQKWVGGVVLDSDAGSMGMAFDTSLVTASGLKGRKSWFMWDGKIIAIGSDIIGGSGPVETILENSKVAEGYTPTLTIDGTPATADATARRQTARWLHLMTSSASAGTGIALLSAATISTLLERRSGSWRDINRDGPTATVQERFLSAALPHDTGAGSYGYVLLPNRSTTETNAFATDPQVERLATDAAIHAVRDRRASIVAAHIWSDAGGTLPGELSSSGPCAVLVRSRGDEIAIAVSRPGATAPATLTLEVARAAREVLSLGDGVTVVSTAPTIRLRVEATAASSIARLRIAS